MCVNIFYRICFLWHHYVSLYLVSNGCPEIDHELPFPERLWRRWNHEKFEIPFKNTLVPLRNWLSFCATISFDFWKEKEDDSSSTDGPVLFVSGCQKFLWSESGFYKWFEISIYLTFFLRQICNILQSHIHIDNCLSKVLFFYSTVYYEQVKIIKLIFW